MSYWEDMPALEEMDREDLAQLMRYQGWANVRTMSGVVRAELDGMIVLLGMPEHTVSAEGRDQYAAPVLYELVGVMQRPSVMTLHSLQERLRAAGARPMDPETTLRILVDDTLL